MNSAATMADAYSNRGNVIMRTTAKMVPMRWTANIPHVRMVNLRVPITDVFR